MASSIIELFLFKLNLVCQHRTFSDRRDFGLLYSYIQDPYMYIAFDENNEWENIELIDMEYRRQEPINWSRYDVLGLVSDLPDFEWGFEHNDDTDDLDYLLLHALYQYLEAITTSKPRLAFGEYWKTVELLTQKSSRSPTRIAVERAEFIYRRNRDRVSNDFEDYVNDLVDMRNEYFHTGYFNANIGDLDYIHTKSLCDELLWFYMDNYDSEASIKDYKRYMESGATKLQWSDISEKYAELDNKFE